MWIIRGYFTLSNITLWRVVSCTIMRIIREMQISKGQIIRTILYSNTQGSCVSNCLQWFVIRQAHLSQKWHPNRDLSQMNTENNRHQWGWTFVKFPLVFHGAVVPVNVSSAKARCHYIISILWPEPMSVGTTFLRNETSLKSRNVQYHNLRPFLQQKM